MKKSSMLQGVSSAIGLVMLAAIGTQTAWADISFVDMFRSITYTQADDVNLLPGPSFFAAHLYSTGANDFSSVQMTYPGPGSPVGLTATDPFTFGFQTGFYPNQAAMDADFPFGTYTFDADGGAASASLVYSFDSYSANVPFFTGNTYSNLQGMNAALPVNFSFGPFPTDPAANFQFMFLDIFDYTSNSFAYIANFLPNTTADLALPANTLQPGHSFAAELIYSNRVLADGIGGNAPPSIGFDLRTSLAFQTAAVSAVPEPGSLALLAEGLAFCALLARVKLRVK